MPRFLPVASGKGGVGKTTFAINFALALSRVAPTVLVDLDTGTSSVRNTLDVEVSRDLYHFLKRGVPLEECITTLDRRLDPDGLFTDFGFIAGPRHAMAEFTMLEERVRWDLIRSLNRLEATFVVLDLPAGFSAYILDFLPLSNSGILVFTPGLPSATLAAADIVKSLLFRKLRLVFAEASPVLNSGQDSGRRQAVRELLDRVENVYDDTLPNLDAFLADLYGALGETPHVRAVAEVIRSFGVYYVLNRFNEVEESFERAVQPFVRHLERYVSASLRLTNLGWLVEDPGIHEGNCRGRPFVLEAGRNRGRTPRSDPVREELRRLESTARGLPLPVRPQVTRLGELLEIDPEAPLRKELELLREMYRRGGRGTSVQNIAYITHRALHVVQTFPPWAFGHPRLYTPLEILDALDATV